MLAVGLSARAQDDTAWVRHLGGDEPLMGRAVAVIGTDVYTVGELQAGEMNFFVARYDGDGDSLWVRSYESTDNEMVVDAVADGTGHLLVAVMIEGDPQEMMLVKLNAVGDTVWMRRQPGLMPRSLAVGPDNAAYVWCNTGHPTPFDSLVLLKYGANGDQLWQRSHRFGEMNQAAGCAIAADRVFAAALVHGSGGMEQMLIAFTSGGDTAWTRLLDVIGNAMPAALAPAPEGGFYFSATEGPMLKLVRCDSEGELVWIHDFPTQTTPENYRNLAVDGHGNVFFATQSPQMTLGFTAVSPDGEELYSGESEVGGEANAVAVDADNRVIVVGTTMEGLPGAVTIKFTWAPGVLSPGRGALPAGRTTGATIIKNRTLDLSLPKTGHWNAVLSGVDGRQAARLYSGSLAAGRYRFSLENLAAGTYILNLDGPEYRNTSRILIP